MSNQARKILLIDDDDDIRGLYADVFRGDTTIFERQVMD